MEAWTWWQIMLLIGVSFIAGMGALAIGFWLYIFLNYGKNG